MPPVAKTRIPAACAAIIVAETVVAAQPPPASAAREVRAGGLRDGPASAPSQRLERRSPGPTRSRPSWIATVAGTAPRLADRGLGRARDLDVLRVRQAVADERRLEGDDGPARRQRGGDLRRDGEPVGEPITRGASCSRRRQLRARAAQLARGRAMAGERRRAGAPAPAPAGRRRAEPAGEEAGVEGVAGAGRVGRRRRRRRDVEPERRLGSVRPWSTRADARRARRA